MVLTIYDIETSGLDENCEIYEFAFIRIDDQFNILNHGVLYFYRDGWPVTAQDSHKLTKEFLEPHMNDFYKNLACMYATLKDCVAVGKNNIRFDNPRVSRFIARNKMDLDKEGIKDFHIAGNIDIQNYMAPFYRQYMQDKGIEVSAQKKGQLEEYIDVCGFSEEVIKQFAESIGIDTNTRWHAHCAMFDTVVTLACLKWLCYAKKISVKPV